MIRFGLMLGMVMLLWNVRAQTTSRDSLLAVSYVQSGEWEKAAELLENLWAKEQSPVYYRPLLECLNGLKRYDAAEKVIRKQIKKFPQEPAFAVDLMVLYQQTGKSKDAVEVLNKALKELPPSEPNIRKLANLLNAARLFEFEIQTYERGNRLMLDPNFFSFELARVLYAAGRTEEAAGRLIGLLEVDPMSLQQIKNMIPGKSGSTGLLDAMETGLLKRINADGGTEVHTDLLSWIYVQRRDYESAILQMKAFDRRKKGKGERVMEIGRMAREEGFFDDALDAFSYVVAKGPSTPLFFSARMELLQTRKLKISAGNAYTTEDLMALKTDYQQLIAEGGYGPSTAVAQKELADLFGFYLHQTDSAILVIERLLNTPGIPTVQRNQAKLSLGDFYLLTGEVWEATLLYAQVDKDERESELGEEARFRNAKLSYYRGEFERAKSQMEVLKSATSRMISNNAIDLFVFIADNSGLDTTYDALAMYADAELLTFQHLGEAALKKLDSIPLLFPGNPLIDDILYAKARIYYDQKKYLEAVPLLEQILEKHPQEILADNAVFLLAGIYDYQLNNRTKAMELYKRILDQYGNSLLVIEARKRYRILRGDDPEALGGM